MNIDTIPKGTLTRPPLHKHIPRGMGRLRLQLQLHLRIVRYPNLTLSERDLPPAQPSRSAVRKLCIRSPSGGEWVVKLV